MLLITLLFITLILLAGVFFLTAFVAAFRSLSSREEKITALKNRFFYRSFHKLLFPEKEMEGLFFVTVCAQSITRTLFAGVGAFFLYASGIFEDIGTEGLQIVWATLIIFTAIVISFIFGDFLPRIIGTRLPEETIKLAAPVSSFFMFIAFPIAYGFLKISQSLSRTVYLDQFQEPLSQTKREIIEIINQANLSPNLDPHDKKLIEAVLEFKERIAREIMIPRVDIFSLQADTTIREAASQLKVEGYSRVPVYKTSVDEVVGVLMYKDIVAKYMEYAENGNDPSIIDAPIDSIMKNVLYTPETKKITYLLQDFRKNKVHQAIVVDEYGGTEGIVTIEDILEEIVGDISDEYDEEGTLMVLKTHDGWIIDARLSILDAEEQLGIKIPQEGDYDTVGGYIFHQAGTIPSKGFVIHHDDFELEIVKSNEKCVEKVKIKSVTPQTAEVPEGEDS